MHANPFSFLDPLAVPYQASLLINGGFWFAQDQAPGTLTNKATNTVDAYGPDGWKISIQNALATAQAQYQRVDTNGALETGLTGRYYGTFKMTSASSKMMMYQPIEGTRCFPYASRTVTFQVRLKASTAMNLKIGILALGSGGTIDTMPTIINNVWSNSTGNDPVLATNVTQLSFATLCSVTTAWKYFSMTVTLPANAKNFMPAIWTNAQLANGDSFSVAEAQLIDDVFPRPWLPTPSLQMEFADVRWFYQKSFDRDTAPAQGIGINTGEVLTQASKVGALTEYLAHRYALPMRATPTITTFNPASANAQPRDIIAGTDCSAIAVTLSGQAGFWASFTGNVSTAIGNLLGLHFTANARL